MSPEQEKLVRLEEREDGLRWQLLLMQGAAVLFRKEYWLGSGGNGAEFDGDKKFLSALLAERDAMREALEEIAECDEDAWGVYHDHAESIGGHERTEPAGFNASERARAALRDLEPKEATDA